MIAGLAVLASLLADGLIFATIAEVLAAAYDSDERHAVGAWAFCIVALAGWALPRAMESFEISERKALAVTGLGGLFVIYLLIRISVYGDVAVWDLSWVRDFMKDAQATTEAGGHAVTAGILLMATWGRATLRSGEEIEMESIPRSATVPFAIVTVFVILGALGDRSGEVGRAGAAFYVMAIMSLAFSQLALSGATFGEMRAGGTAGVMLLGTVGMAVVGLLVIGLLVTVFGPIVGPILSKTTEVVLTIALTPFAWLLQHIFEWLFAGASPFPELTNNAAQTSQDAADPESAGQSPASKAGLFVMRMFALALFLGAAALVATVFVRLRHRRARQLLDDRATDASGSLRDDLGSMFRGLFRRKEARPVGFASTETTRLYLEVLAKAEGAGHSRPDGETASEFAPELQETFANPVTDDITRAFEAARYGGREPDARTVEELRQRWQRESS